MNSPEQPKPKVLVADDVESISNLMKFILVKNGFTVDVAADGEECLEKVRTFNPHLVILDIMMPKMHGLDVLKEINKAENPPGVIMCTSKSYKPDQDRALELGAFDYIVKPFHRDEFLQKVQKYFLGWTGIEETSEEKPEHGSLVDAFIPKIETSRCFCRLWGTRGSVPVSGLRYMHHGGNTSCISFECGDEIIIFDAGTGIRELGMELLKQPPRRLHMFISHTHWDHIQGFPFFVPAFLPGFEIIVYGASGFGKDLESVFRGQFDRDYFPIQMDDMKADFKFVHLGESPLCIGDTEIYWEFTHHPGAALGYKIRANRRMVGYVSDNEFLKGYLGHPDNVTRDSELLQPYNKLVEFMSDIDVLISEAQYTNEEYQHKIGWGHSSLSNACHLMRLAGIKKWIVTHHDPMHDDEFLHKKLNLTRQIMRELNYQIDVSNGFDGLIEYL
ncbi:response regulator [bacterium]|nr:response regulator [bacterium]